jgi:hypothetical protein
MNRIASAVFLLFATTAAGPAPSLPVPPIPPVDAPADRSAPVPDPDLRAPTEPGQRVQVSIQDFRVQRFYQGLGYTPGSHFETSEEKRPIQTPGLSLKVPLQ